MRSYFECVTSSFPGSKLFLWSKVKFSCYTQHNPPINYSDLYMKGNHWLSFRYSNDILIRASGACHRQATPYILVWKYLFTIWLKVHWLIMVLRNPKLHFLDLLCYFKLGDNTSIQNVEVSEDQNIRGSLSKRHLARTPDLSYSGKWISVVIPLFVF